MYCKDMWTRITSDKFIIDVVTHGLRIKFEDIPTSNVPHLYPKPAAELPILSAELQRLREKGVIVPTEREAGDFFSNIFLTPKSGGKFRLILNLKQLNQYVTADHFKMESIKNVLHMIKQDAWMASVDLKDAFYTVPIHSDHQKFLKFCTTEGLFKFVCMPNGYNDAMRVFTKILKPCFAFLRESGHLSVVYVDDSYLQGDTEEECHINILETVSLLQKLGFTIHVDKSVLQPTQTLTFLGFVINSQAMTLTLTEEKKDKIKKLATKIISNTGLDIRTLAKFLGNLVASFEAVPHGPLHYRFLENDKINALKLNKGNFDAKVCLSPLAIDECHWWRDNIHTSFRTILPLPISHTIYTDASELGWGATDTVTTANGRWTIAEQTQHINVLELMAIKFAVLSFITTGYTHIRIMSDNATSIAYINKMGGTKSSKCDKIAREVWDVCIQHHCWISAAHIPGTKNIVADRESRQFHDAAEWMLQDSVFKYILSIWGVPDMDMFATRINKKLDKYCSWKPDPGAMHVDAFSISWEGLYIYCFPPFSIIWRVLHKISRESEEALVVVPLWTTQTWFPALMRLIVDTPIIIQGTKLELPGTHRIHPMCPKLKLLICRLSRNTYRHKVYLQQQKILSYHPGDHPHNPDMHLLLRNGKTFVLKNRLICFHQMP